MISGESLAFYIIQSLYSKPTLNVSSLLPGTGADDKQGGKVVLSLLLGGKKAQGKAWLMVHVL